MFTSDSFSEGQTLTKVSLFDYATSTGNIQIYFGGTSKPEMAIHQQPYETTGTKDYVEFDLTAPIPLFSDNLWVIFSTNEGSNYPAAMCENTGDKNGRWISLDGATWEDITDYDLDGTWMIRAYIEGGENVSELNSSFNIYPNPVNDRLYIETEVEIKEVAIYTITGVLVGQQTTDNRQQTLSIDVTNLNNGVYFVKVVTDNGEVVKRFVKK